jgi:hypothetical protein
MTRLSRRDNQQGSLTAGCRLTHGSVADAESELSQHHRSAAKGANIASNDNIKGETNWSRAAINSRLTLDAGPGRRTSVLGVYRFSARNLIFSIMFMTLMYTQSDAPQHVVSAAPGHKFPSASSIREAKLDRPSAAAKHFTKSKPNPAFRPRFYLHQLGIAKLLAHSAR